jgi:hypothetical protein
MTALPSQRIPREGAGCSSTSPGVAEGDVLSDWTPADLGFPERTSRLCWDLVSAFAPKSGPNDTAQHHAAGTTLRQVKTRIIRSYLRELPLRRDQP